MRGMGCRWNDMGDLSKEPSMEEILSSIKRIIAEDGGGQPGQSGRRGVARRDAERETHRKAVVASMVREEPGPSYVDEVLELTEELPHSGRGGTDAAAGLSAETDLVEADDMPDEELELTDSMTDHVERRATVPATEDDSIVSVESEVAARTSLAALSSMIVKAQEPGDNTLEGLVREMLRPMMKEWLDANLPTLVEGMVAKEIARITGHAL